MQYQEKLSTMSDKRLCVFILPYYGKFPNYFQLFLNSCGSNPEYDWLIFTDDHTAYDYPDNVPAVLLPIDRAQMMLDHVEGV